MRASARLFLLLLFAGCWLTLPVELFAGGGTEIGQTKKIAQAPDAAPGGIAQDGFTDPDSTGPFSKEAFRIGGYLKNLQVITHLPTVTSPLLPSSTFTTFFHHRLNTEWRPNRRWTLAWEQRSRFFIGDDVQLNPAFGETLGMDAAAVDASWVPWSGDAALLHTRVERLWIEHRRRSWEARIGRQRINWGVHLVWNPNDLFNAYNFLDFDYAERPGADAVRVLGYLNNGHVLEAAWAPGIRAADWTLDSLIGQGHTAALRYGFAIGSYDIQAIAGWRQTDAVLALGWAGNLGQAGLKGEAAWFRQVQAGPGVPLSPTGERDAYTVALSLDQSFGSAWYALLGGLYASTGTTGTLNTVDGVALAGLTPPSPNALSPSRWTLISQASYTPMPLLGLDVSVLYGPGPDLLILFPSLRYNMAENWDISLTGQIFWLGTEDAAHGADLQRQADAAIVRVTWSY